MRPFARNIAYFFIVLLVLIITASSLLKVFVDPNDYKQQITTYIEKQTGHQLHITGPIALSFFPWLGVSVQDVTMDSTDQFKNTTLLTVGSAAIKIHLWPLLIGRVQVKNITLNHPNIHLITDSNGKSNWAIQKLHDHSDRLSTSSSASTTAKPLVNTKDNKSAATSKHRQFNIHITSIIINHAEVVFNNQLTGKQYSLHDAFISSQNINLVGKPMIIAARFHYSESNPEINFRLSFTGGLGYNNKSNAIDVWSGKMAGEFLSIHGNLAKPVTYNTWVKHFHYDNKDILLDHWHGQLNKAIASANIDIKMSPSAPQQINGTINTHTIHPNKLAAALNQHLPALSGFHKLSLDATVKTTNGTIYIHPSQLNINGNALDVTAGYQPPPQNHLEFTIKADQINLDPILQGLNQASEPSNSSTSTVSQNSRQLSVPKSSPKTSAIVNNRNNSDAADWYLSTGVTGNISIQQLTANRLLFNQLYIGIKRTTNGINFTPITAKFYQGSINSNLAITLNTPLPTFTGNVLASNVRLKPVLTALMNKDPVDGTANFSVTAKTMGLHQSTRIRNLNGKGNFSVSNGEVYGFDLNSLVNQAARFLSHGRVSKPKFNTGHETNFNVLKGSYTINNGIINNNDLVLSAQQAMASGQGLVNLNNQTIDYKLSVGPHARTPQQQPWQFPLTIKGPLAKPKVSPDVSAIIGELIKNVIKDTSKDTGKKIHQFIKGLFN